MLWPRVESWLGALCNIDVLLSGKMIGLALPRPYMWIGRFQSADEYKDRLDLEQMNSKNGCRCRRGRRK